MPLHCVKAGVKSKIEQMISSQSDLGQPAVSKRLLTTNRMAKLEMLICSMVLSRRPTGFSFFDQSCASCFTDGTEPQEGGDRRQLKQYNLCCS